MRKQIQLWGSRTLGVVLVAVAFQYWGMPVYKQYFSPKKVEAFIPTTKVRQGSLTVSFHEVGTLQATVSVPVISSISGKIISIVQEGTPVKKGDKLVELDTTDIERRVRDAQLRYENALADVSRVKSERDILVETNKTDYAKTKAQYDFDTTEMKRADEEMKKKTRLADEKLVPRADADQAAITLRAKQLAVDKDKMDLDLKQTEIAAKEGQKGVEVRKVEFAAKLAKSDLDDELGHQSSAVINAPSGGMAVLGTFYREGVQKFKIGDQIERHQKVMELPDLSQMQVNVSVGEADAPKVKLNQKVLIRLDAVPDKVYHGTVSGISVLATEARWWESGAVPGRKNFDVTIDVKESDSKHIKPGMTADVEFVCDTIQKSLYVPIECIQERAGKTYCYVKTGKQYVRKELKTGKQNDNFIAITKGLALGDEVALRDPTKAAQAGEQKQEGVPGEKPETTAPVPEAGSKK